MSAGLLPPPRPTTAPELPEDEGLSYIVAGNNGQEKRVLLKDAIELIGDEIIGKQLMEEYGGWPMFSKFFDNHAPLPHHVHLDDEYRPEWVPSASRKRIISRPT